MADPTNHSAPEPIVGAGYTFNVAVENALKLEQLLLCHDIVVEQGSALEGSILRAVDIGYRWSGASAALVAHDIRDDYRNLTGVNSLAAQLLAVSDHKDFPQLVPHLRMLNSGEALQNLKAPQRDQVSNKLFELFAATLAMQCGTNVLLDDPGQSRGDNPDVLFSVAGRRWGIACKALHSLNSEGFIGHLQKGIAQIEASEADVGVVFFSLKNVLNHDSYWPITNVAEVSGGAPPEFATFVDPTVPFQWLQRDARSIGDKLKAYLPKNHLDLEFNGKKSIPGFLTWSHTTTGILVNGHPAPAAARILLFNEWRPVGDGVRRTLECLNWAAFADSPSRGERPVV